jgi:hypothetical protein
MNLVVGAFVFAAVLVLGLVLFGGGYVTGRIVGFFRALPERRRRRRLARAAHPLPPLPVQEEGADLLGYPRRLEDLEGRLVERHRAVQEQLRLLSARREGVRAKGDREDLLKKYEADVAMLDRRAEGMRRVMGLVWKTRAILLFRVHHAVTARRRPSLGKLPEPTGGVTAPAGATASYHAAAAAVLFYRDLVEARAGELAAVVPSPPVSAEVTEAQRREVEAERAQVAAAYAALGARMDRLADNLTYVGDHYAALAVVDTEPEDLAVDGGPAHLLEEVAAAVRGLDELGARVDPAAVDDAVSGLAEDITHLEEAGLEAEAEAAAHLEVERLLGQFPSS